MVDLLLTISPGRCRHDGCFNSSGMFGVCPDHQTTNIDRYFVKVVARGSAKPKTPACFNSSVQWKEYIVAAALCRPTKKSKDDAFSRAIDYCKDCTASFKSEMCGLDRCDHPETVFIRATNNSGDLIGVSIADPEKTDAWERAVMGMSGPVIQLPAESVINEKLTAISTPKKRGPKPKVRDSNA